MFEEDSLTPIEQGRMLDQMIPNSQLSVVRGATHGVIREEPAISNAVILSWLTSNFSSLGEIESSDDAAEKIIVPNKEKLNR